MCYVCSKEPSRGVLTTYFDWEIRSNNFQLHTLIWGPVIDRLKGGFVDFQLDKSPRSPLLAYLTFPLIDSAKLFLSLIHFPYISLNMCYVCSKVPSQGVLTTYFDWEIRSNNFSYTLLYEDLSAFVFSVLNKSCLFFARRYLMWQLSQYQLVSLWVYFSYSFLIGGMQMM